MKKTIITVLLLANASAYAAEQACDANAVFQQVKNFRTQHGATTPPVLEPEIKKWIPIEAGKTPGTCDQKALNIIVSKVMLDTDPELFQKTIALPVAASQEIYSTAAQANPPLNANIHTDQNINTNNHNDNKSYNTIKVEHDQVDTITKYGGMLFGGLGSIIRAAH